MSEPFPVFGPNGKLMGNLTSSWGETSIPAIASPVFPSLGSVISKGSAGSADNVKPNGAAITVLPSNAQAVPSPGQNGTAIRSGSLADYFLRGIVIVLGFIFIAIGLNMFRPGTIPTPRIGAG